MRRAGDRITPRIPVLARRRRDEGVLIEEGKRAGIHAIASCLRAEIAGDGVALACPRKISQEVA